MTKKCTLSPATPWAHCTSTWQGEDPSALKHQHIALQFQGCKVWRPGEVVGASGGSCKGCGSWEDSQDTSAILHTARETRETRSISTDCRRSNFVLKLWLWKLDTNKYGADDSCGHDVLKERGLLHFFLALSPSSPTSSIPLMVNNRPSLAPV